MLINQINYSVKNYFQKISKINKRVRFFRNFPFNKAN